MAKDAHDDPYTIQGSPDVVLECADCHEVGPIVGTRFVGPNDPQEPLCPEDWAVAVRVWGRDRLHELGAPSAVIDDKGTVGVRRTCPRCGGAGRVKGTEGTCFECMGYRWVHLSPKAVRRAARWSQTFQQNRTP